jgi:hypothetical protein
MNTHISGVAFGIKVQHQKTMSYNTLNTNNTSDYNNNNSEPKTSIKIRNKFQIF